MQWLIMEFLPDTADFRFRLANKYKYWLQKQTTNTHNEQLILFSILQKSLNWSGEGYYSAIRFNFL